MLPHPRVALATCCAQPNLYEEEQRLIPMLADHGVDARAAVWDDPSVDWTRFDVVFLRSVWDYFEKYPAFRRWIAGLAQAEVAVQNPVSLVEWNADKAYLRELAARGVRIPPTVFLEAREPIALAALVAERGWQRVVVKPAVSAGAWRTALLTSDELASYQPEFERVLAHGDVLVQPFLPEIQGEGEWSFLFFGGVFSHAILKKPPAGDYRVQPQFGGTAERVPSDAVRTLVDEASSVLAALPEPPAYARIDGVRIDGRFVLMEAELIEPYLFFGVAPETMETFVALVAHKAQDAASMR